MRSILILYCTPIEFGDRLEEGSSKALMVNNADWLMDLNYIEFIRDIGVHFSGSLFIRHSAIKCPTCRLSAVGSTYGEGLKLPGVQLHDYAEL